MFLSMNVYCTDDFSRHKNTFQTPATAKVVGTMKEIPNSNPPCIFLMYFCNIQINKKNGYYQIFHVVIVVGTRHALSLQRKQNTFIMTQVLGLTFNSFQENMYLVYDDTGECVIFDPGCNSTEEQNTLVEVIESKKLKPVRLINTHCHLDHVFGNHFVAKTYGLELEIHEGEVPVLEAVPRVCKMYGIPMMHQSPEAGRFIEVGETIEFGASKLEVLFTPGHSPASLSFYCAEAGFVIAGDVLFMQSIGRTDLPGGDMATLLRSIREQIFPLGDDVKVFPGHGPMTTVGYEKLNNPFLTS